MCAWSSVQCEQTHLTQSAPGFHRADNFWCVVVKLVHERLLEGNCRNSSGFCFDLNGQKSTIGTKPNGTIHKGDTNIT